MAFLALVQSMACTVSTSGLRSGLVLNVFERDIAAYCPPQRPNFQWSRNFPNKVVAPGASPKAGDLLFSGTPVDVLTFSAVHFSAVTFELNNCHAYLCLYRPETFL